MLIKILKLFKPLFEMLPISFCINLQVWFNKIKQKNRRLSKNYISLRSKYASAQEEKLVSIIMPSWNRRSIISKSINSVLKQSYINYELIIIDDGSTDGTKEFIKNAYFDQLKTGVIVLLENPHKGVSYSRNTGLDIAKGDIIAYLDSDNTWDESYLRIMVGELNENLEYVCCYSGLKIKNYQTGRAEVFFEEYFSYEKLKKGNFIDMNAFIHKAILKDNLGGFDISLSRLVDWDLLLKYTKDKEPLAVPIAAVNYFLSKELNNITFSESFDENYSKVKNKVMT